MQDVKQRIHHIEVENTEMDREVKTLKEQNRKMQASITTLECKALENYLRLWGVMEEKGENISEVVAGLFAKLGE